MTKDVSSPVPLEAYTESYYLSQVGGVEFFKRYGFEVLKPDTQAALRAARLLPGDAALDVGCGRGELVAHLTRKGMDIVGIDYSAEAIKIAHQLCPEARYLCGELDGADLLGATYDVIFFLGTIQHLTDEQIEDFFNTVKKRLKPRGRLVVTTCDNPLYYKRWTFGVRDSLALFLGRLGLPVRRPLPPVSAHDKVVHVNDQTPRSLKRWGSRYGWGVQVDAKMNPKLDVYTLYGPTLPKDFPIKPAPPWKRFLFRPLAQTPLRVFFARNYLAVLTPLKP